MTEMIFTTDCQCCGRKYESANEEGHGIRCSLCCMTCYMPKGSTEWVRGHFCPTVTGKSEGLDYECVHECEKRDRYRIALELIYKRLNDTVEAGYNIESEISDIAFNALWPNFKKLRKDSDGH